MLQMLQVCNRVDTRRDGMVADFIARKEHIKSLALPHVRPPLLPFFRINMFRLEPKTPKTPKTKFKKFKKSNQIGTLKLVSSFRTG
jgi:hypothetical protein